MQHHLDGCLLDGIALFSYFCIIYAGCFNVFFFLLLLLSTFLCRYVLFHIHTFVFFFRIHQTIGACVPMQFLFFWYEVYVHTQSGVADCWICCWSRSVVYLFHHAKYQLQHYIYPSSEIPFVSLIVLCLKLAAVQQRRRRKKHRTQSRRHLFSISFLFLFHSFAFPSTTFCYLAQFTILHDDDRNYMTI